MNNSALKDCAPMPTEEGRISVSTREVECLLDRQANVISRLTAIRSRLIGEPCDEKTCGPKEARAISGQVDCLESAINAAHHRMSEIDDLIGVLAKL